MTAAVRLGCGSRMCLVSPCTLQSVHPHIFTLCNLQGQVNIATFVGPCAGSCDQANCPFRLVRYRCCRPNMDLVRQLRHGKSWVEPGAQNRISILPNMRKRDVERKARQQESTNTAIRLGPAYLRYLRFPEMTNSNCRCPDLSMRTGDYGRCMMEMLLTASLAIEHTFSLWKGCQTVTMACCYCYLLTTNRMPNYLFDT
jgi:hypothetical protein